jgi:hypothetical protein
MPRAKPPAAWRLVDIELGPQEAGFSCFAFNRKKLRQARRREGRYAISGRVLSMQVLCPAGRDGGRLQKLQR